MSYTPAQADKIHKVMHEFKHGKLHSGSKQGKKVEDRKQAIAIALSEAGIEKSVEMSDDDFINEHTKLVDVLLNGSKEERKKEVTAQKEEMKEEINKAFDTLGILDVIEKGGTVIGRTKSGKSIYSMQNAHHEKDYSSQDHEDAAYAHLDRQVALEKKNLRDSAVHHSNEYDRHMETSRHKKQTEGSSDINKAFDTLETDVIEKAFTGQGLIKKKVQIHGHNGKIYEGYRYVSPDTGLPVNTGKESKETIDFKQAKQKELSSVKTTEEKTQVEGKHDEDFGNKILEISERGGKKSSRVRDLVSMGVYDPNFIMQLNPDIKIVDVNYYIKEAGIDPKKFQENALANINIALGHKSVASEEEHLAIYELQNTLKQKELKEILKKSKEERSKKENITADDKFDLYEMYLDNVVDEDSLCRSLIAYGTGGIGKTFTLNKILKDAGKVGWDPELDLQLGEYDYVKVTGNTSPTDLYNLMYANSRKLIIFDDCDSMWDNKEMANMLKGALDTSGDGMVRYANPKEIKEGTEKGTKPTQSFKFNGKIVFISNLPRERFPQPLVDSRSQAIDLSMDMDQTIARIEKIKDNFEFLNAKREKVDVPPKYIDDIIHFIKDFKNDLRIEQVNGRILTNLASLRMMLAKKGQDDYDTFRKKAMIQMDLV